MQKPPQSVSQPKYPMSVGSIEEKFSVLRLIASIFRGLAILAIILEVLVTILILTGGLRGISGSSSSANSSLLLMGVSILGGVLTAIFFETLSQGIKLFIAIEHNQRIQEEYLRQLIIVNSR